MMLKVHIVYTSAFNTKPFPLGLTRALSLSCSPDTIATCWYILLSGSVFVKEHMYLARCWYVSLTEEKNNMMG